MMNLSSNVLSYSCWECTSTRSRGLMNASRLPVTFSTMRHLAIVIRPRNAGRIPEDVGWTINCSMRYFTSSLIRCGNAQLICQVRLKRVLQTIVTKTRNPRLNALKCLRSQSATRSDHVQPQLNLEAGHVAFHESAFPVPASDGHGNRSN